MIWLYRLQQRLSITRREGIAVLTLTVLFVTGLTVRHVKRQQVPPVAPDSLVVTAGKDASQTAPGPKNPSPSRANPVNVNRAPREKLQQLQGIGPALSDRIIQYRTTQRPFQRIEELKRVRGIGPKTLADLRPTITVQATETETDASNSDR